MSKSFKNLSALVCALCLLVTLLCPAAAAAESDQTEAEVITYVEIPLYENDKLIGTGLKIESLTYVPLAAFCRSMLDTPCSVSWNNDTGELAISAEGLELSLTLGDKYMVANGRYIRLPQGAYNIHGSIVVPIRSIAKVFGVKISWDDENWSVDLDRENISILSPGREFYDETELYWLSHVIYAESGNQPLDGKIGVGNVVLNRVADRSGAFPDSIYEVIFQPGQFSVVDAGTIYLEPNPESVIAAKLCLEGYNTVGDSLFFLNPTISDDYWFRSTRSFVASIQDHDFYA